MRDADIAMYRAANGKARYEVFDVAMHAHAVEALTLERELRRALERNEIRVHYQPIYSLADQVLVDLKLWPAGTRKNWVQCHPSSLFRSPKRRLVIPLGMTVLTEACWQMHSGTVSFLQAQN